MMSETRTDYYDYNDRSELTNAVKNATLNEYAYQYDDIGNRLSSLDLGTNRTYTANALNQYTLVGRDDPIAPHEEFSPQYDLDMRPRRRRRVARRSVATEPRSGRKRLRNKNVSDVVSFQQARGVPAHYEYAPFGAVIAVITNTAFTAFNVAEANPFRFSSEYSGDTLGLVYYNYRHYNPMDGRWLQRDPYNSLGNSYSFGKNSTIFTREVGRSVAKGALRMI